MKKKKTFFIKTFGCQMNASDSEKIAGWYQSKGWQPTKKILEADEVIINTCSVRESAENRVHGLVNNLAKERIKNRKFKIVLTGCMLRYPLWWLQKKLPQVNQFKKLSNFSLPTSLKVRDSKTHAWVPIMEGCNNFCSYCVVPTARGREKSRPFKEILCEIKKLTERGYDQITLLGQNVNSYGKDLSANSQKLPKGENKTAFANLLQSLNKVKKLKKISFLTSNPWDLDEEIIKAMSLDKIDRYLHLPVQSGDDEILKKMNRKYTSEQYFSLIKKIRKIIPDIKIGTDIIVGFPGETEKQFRNTVKLCKKVGFEKAYIAMYSPRPLTAAFKLKNNLSHQEKRKRWRILDKLINGED